ncbi:MAG: amidohydrolase family protein [Planctomycetota bacterium]|nr:amidohydrolase family protein [Planctomycetota bacterium]
MLGRLAALFLLATAAGAGQVMMAVEEDAPTPAGEPGGPGLAVLTAKALTCPPDIETPQLVDNAVVLIRDGKIERVAPQRGTKIPTGYEVLDVGDLWVMPGLVELHCHVGGTFDINDMVYLTNPGLSASTSVIPHNDALKMAIAGGVTTVLYIPGSGTNIGGLGVLFKTGLDHYEDALIRDPGSMKLAQWGNPESWGPRIGMTFEHWNTRNTLRRGVAYAKRWEAFEAGEGPEPERDIQFDVFRPLVAGETTISTHTQLYQVVLMTLTMVHGEFGLPVFLDHSTIGGWLAGGMAEEMGVPAIVGPRSVDTVSRFFINWARNKHEGMRGVAAGYQQMGLKNVGFNTDSPVIPQETLQLQSAMGVRYGFDDSELQAVRGLTIVPAMAAKIDHVVGSLEPGKDADILIIRGHPSDPRSSVEKVLIEGKLVYDATEDRRRW